MDQSSKKLSLTLIGVIGIVALLAALVLVFYNCKKSSPTPLQSTQSAPVTIATAVPAAHSQPFTKEQRAEIQKIFLETVRQKPDLFINSMNEGMKSQQDQARKDLEKDATTKSKEILEAGLPLGNLQANLKLVAFIDPVCPHCQNFIKLAFNVLKSRSDVLFYIVPVAILGERSTLLSKTLIAAYKQGHKEFSNFLQKLSQKSYKLDKVKFASFVKEAKLNPKKFEQDFNSETVHKQLMSNSNLAETIKVPGVPTIFGIQTNGDFVIVPPTEIKEFNKLIDNLKVSKPLTAGGNPTRVDTDEN